MRDLNRGWGGRSLEAQNSVRHLKIEIEKALAGAAAKDRLVFDLKVRRLGEDVAFDYAIKRGHGEVLESATMLIDND